MYQNEFARKVARWLDAMPHPPLAIEISPERVAAARWSRTGSLDGFAVEVLPSGAIIPSAVETNIVNMSVAVAGLAGIL